MDEGGFVLDFRTPPGTSLAETSRRARQVEAILKETPEVETFSERIGFGLGGDLQEGQFRRLLCALKGGSRRPIDEVMSDVRQRIAQNVPGFEVELAQLMEDLIGDLTGVPQPIEVKLTAINPADLIPRRPRSPTPSARSRAWSRSGWHCAGRRRTRHQSGR